MTAYDRPSRGFHGDTPSRDKGTLQGNNWSKAAHHQSFSLCDLFFQDIMYSYLSQNHNPLQATLFVDLSSALVSSIKNYSFYQCLKYLDRLHIYGSENMNLRI